MLAAGPVKTDLSYPDSPEVTLVREMVANTASQYLGYSQGDLSVTLKR
jgi:hypothetical protein